ncbi:MAG: PorV/PorQ family protein [Spirochaetes bacterium]|nr:PorV/PorQ family protein [Spirochaetota bacterium]
MKRILFLSFILLCVTGLLKAVDPGTKSMTFLNIAPNPRASALGEGFTALADDVSAVYFNPAGIANLKNTQVAANVNLYIASINYFNFQAAHPFGFGTLGVNASFVSYGDIDNYENGQLLGTIAPSDVLASLAYGLKITDKFQAGLSLKYVSEKLTDTYSGSAFGIDLGLLYLELFKHLNVGLVAQNIGSGPQFSQETGSLPLTIKLGTVYTYRLYRAVAGLKDINVLVDFIFPSDADMQTRYGLEAWWYNLGGGLLDAALRIGAKFPTDFDVVSSLTFGAGIRMFNTQLDYAMVNFGDLGMTHRIGVLYRFGDIMKPFEPPPSKEEVKEEKKEEKPVEEEEEEIEEEFEFEEE